MKKIFIFLSLILSLSISAVAAETKNSYPSSEKAKQELEKLLLQYDANQKDPRFLQQIGFCYHSLGAAGDAEAVIKAMNFFQKALDLEPDNNEIRAWLGSATVMRARDVWVFEQPTYINTGSSLLDIAVSTEPNNTSIRTTRGNTYLSVPSFLGKDSIAVSDFEFVAGKLRGSEDKELLQEVYYKLGLAYKKVNNAAKAKENFNMAISINSTSEMAKKIVKEERL